jgi:2-polyprenyl-6-methoxyphenol hydroxylase-like FAD-dependent oxidoreductase
MPQNDCNVFIAGAGPVGLTLALDLASRGLRVIVAEARQPGHMPTVRCNHISARTMEVFRRLGLAATIRASGLPGDYHQGVSYRTTTVGRELAKIRIPSREDRFTVRDDGPDGWWPTPEPPHRMNQIFLEPILVQAAQAHPLIDLRYETESLHFDQTPDCVTVHLRGEDLYQITADYMVGCDGGRSPTRKAIGATLSGDAIIQRVQSTYIRAKTLIGLMQEPPSWAMFSMNPRRTGNIYSIDGREKWLIHNYLRDAEADFDSVDRDRCIRDILGVGDDFDYEIIANEDWFGRRLVTDKLRAGRVFICGDAAHLWVPYAGYGMNAGIADAINLSWLLAAVVQGWGDPHMLDAYTAERLPITEQVSRYAMAHCEMMAKQRSSVPDTIEDDTAEGAAARARLGREAYDLNVQQYCCAGLNFGYYYDHSPIILGDGTPAPAYSMADFTPSSVPGCRVPHFWLAEGRSLLDALGPDYTLLRLDPSIDTAVLLEEAARQGVPLEVLDIDPPADVAAHYPQPLLIVRPDHHVAWRGAQADAEAATSIISVLRGANTDTPNRSHI